MVRQFSYKKFLPVFFLFQTVLSSAAFAKVIFTGYADLRNIYGYTNTSLSPALSKTLGVSRTRSQESTFNIDSLGLFASTQFNEQLGFELDVTYKNIGFKVGEIRLQYAYLDYKHPSLLDVKAGKVTLPIGYYNQHYFYPFQRKSVEPPIFQSAILGLPISDIGVNVEKVFDAGESQFKASAYVVNGYSQSDNSTASTSTFRPGLGASGALILSNNLRATNSNETLAAGGEFEFGFLEEKRMKIGASGYYGPWSTNSKDDFTMMNGYLFYNNQAFELLGEYLFTKARNDRGVVGFFGADDWISSGYFAETALRIFQKEDKQVHWFGGFENTVVKGDTAGTGTEELMNYKTGFAFKPNNFVTLKTEYSHLKYQIPIQSGGVADILSIDRDRIYLNATISY